MKKIFIVLVFTLFAVSAYSQNMFKPVPKNFFLKTQTVETLEVAPGTVSEWLWRFNVTVVANEFVWDKVAKQFNSVPLSGVGPGIGYRHYYQAPDGIPASDFGVNFVLLWGTDIDNISPANLKPALTVNAFNFLNVGVDYGIKTKAFGILLGAQVSF
jgi:hypothetical protein